MNEVCIDSASEEAHAISSLRSDKVLVDPLTNHKRRKDPLEEKDDHPSPSIIPEGDSDDEDDGYYVAYKPITFSSILFMFVEMKFIHCHSCVMFAMKSMSMCND